jgi:hypothetical protein
MHILNLSESLNGILKSDSVPLFLFYHSIDKTILDVNKSSYNFLLSPYYSSLVRFSDNINILRVDS